jgi:MFS transporter, DHA2 family, multidrug resistance protein
MSLPTSLPPAKLLFFATGLTGSFLVSLSTQFASVNIADIQAGVHSSADEASWILTVYTMATMAGVLTAGILIKAFGVRRYLIGSATTFALVALVCALAPPLDTMIILRAIQGFAAGGFGPAGFIAVFTVMTGQLRPVGVILLALVLVFPTTLGPVISGYVENGFGWQALFLIQAAIGVVIAISANFFAPRQGTDWSALNTDWMAVILLSVAVASAMLVVNQGTRRFWFENEIIVVFTALGIGAFAGFAFLARFSPLAILNPRLLLTRKFGIPVSLYFIFRVGLVVIAYLVPQFLALVQGYRPVEVSELMLWATIPQLLALPLVWWLMHRVEARTMMALGLLLAALGAALVADGTALAAAPQFHFTLTLFAVGQFLFLAPSLMIGTSILTPPDLPTASVAFNVATTGGATLGTGLFTNFVTEREKFHSNVLTEGVSLYNPLDSDRLAALANVFAGRITDDALTTAQAAAALASGVRQQAWVLSFNDAFLVVAALLAVSSFVTIAIGRSPALKQIQQVRTS